MRPEQQELAGILEKAVAAIGAQERQRIAGRWFGEADQGGWFGTLRWSAVWPFFRLPWWMRSSARRPRNGDASRLVTCACSGAPSTYVGAGMVSMIVRTSGSRSVLSAGSVPSSGLVRLATPALPEA